MSSTIDPETFQRPDLSVVAVVDVSGSMGWDYGARGNPAALVRSLLGRNHLRRRSRGSANGEGARVNQPNAHVCAVSKDAAFGTVVIALIAAGLALPAIGQAQGSPQLPNELAAEVTRQEETIDAVLQGRKINEARLSDLLQAAEEIVQIRRTHQGER